MCSSSDRSGRLQTRYWKCHHLDEGDPDGVVEAWILPRRQMQVGTCKDVQPIGSGTAAQLRPNHHYYPSTPTSMAIWKISPTRHDRHHLPLTALS